MCIYYYYFILKLNSFKNINLLFLCYYNMNWSITETKNLEKFNEKIFEMYENSYKDIGLIDFGGWDGLKNYLNCSCYLLTNSTQEINGIILYWLSDYGNKISLVISANSEIGKIYVIPKLVELLQISGFYIELEIISFSIIIGKFS